MKINNESKVAMNIFHVAKQQNPIIECFTKLGWLTNGLVIFDYE